MASHREKRALWSSACNANARLFFVSSNNQIDVVVVVVVVMMIMVPWCPNNRCAIDSKPATRARRTRTARL